MIRTIVADKTTAIVTAQAVSSALYAREKTGRGDHIRVAMLDAMLSYLWPEGMSQYTVIDDDGKAPDPNDRPDLVFKTQDGYITCGTISDSEWQGFCRATGDPALAADERFATPAKRSVNATARIHKMQEYISQRTTAEWLARLDEADVPCAPILRRNEIIGNEQVVARQIIEELDQPSVGRIRQPKPAARFETNRRAHRRTGAAHRRALQADTPRSRLRGRRHRRNDCKQVRSRRRIEPEQAHVEST